MMPFKKITEGNLKPSIELFPESVAILDQIKEKFKINGMKNTSKTFIINKLITKYGDEYANSI